MVEEEHRLFGHGKYMEDTVLVFRKPFRPRNQRLLGSLECFKRAIFVLGALLLVAMILSIVVVMLLDLSSMIAVADQSSNNLSMPSSLPIPNITFIPIPPKMIDINLVVLNREVEDGTIWSANFTPATSEFSSLVFDANSDGNPDILVIHMTERLEQTEYCHDQCDKDYGHTPCQVQLAVLDGNDGSIVWGIWLEFAPFAANCEHDLNGDEYFDCILSGRSGSLIAIDIVQHGTIIWVVDPGQTFPLYNFYYPLIVKDFNKDGTLDLIITHGGDVSYSPSTKDRTPGVIMVISGRTGQILSERIPMPDDHETYSSPILYSIVGNIELILFGSGGETISGPLWGMTLNSLQTHVDIRLEDSVDQYISSKRYLNPRCVASSEYGPKRPRNSVNTFKYADDKEDWLSECPVWNTDTQPLWNPYKICVYEIIPAGKTGTIIPPVIIDYNNDGIKDLLVSQFNDHVMMMDGATTSIVWDHYAEDTQSYSIPSPLNFNNDNIPDFLFRFNKGKWMMYDYSYMAVIDGSNGELLWSLNCSLGAMGSAITVKSNKPGHDGMLFLASGCKINENSEVYGRPKRIQRNECKLDKHIEFNCWEQETREKRHEDDDNDDNDSVSADELSDLWETLNEDDTFPDPWTDTQLFIEEYCDVSYNALTTDVFYLTPTMINSGNIKPIYTYKPYVYRFPSDLFSNANLSLHGSNSHHRRKSLRCSQILVPSMLMSTPIIGDFNQDGKLDGATTINYVSQNEQLNVFNSQNVNYNVFTIEDRLVEVYGSGIRDVVEFSSYYSSREQPWGKYMGSKGNGIFENK